MSLTWLFWLAQGSELVSDSHTDLFRLLPVTLLQSGIRCHTIAAGFSVVTSQTISKLVVISSLQKILGAQFKTLSFP